MKYLLLIYSNAESWGHPIFLRTSQAREMTEDARSAMEAEFDALLTEIHDSGELVSVAALADPATARTVRAPDGAPVATDGPFGESKEQLAGVFVVDCATPERAEQIAGRFPDTRFGAVELRPIMGAGGQEM
ncbi:MAG TPA: YciI family protein [Actinocatenispora sp.]